MKRFIELIDVQPGGMSISKLWRKNH